MKKSQEFRHSLGRSKKKVPSHLNRIRHSLPPRTSGFLQVDVFSEAHFDDHGVWLMTPEGVFRAFHSSEGWGAWRRHDIALGDMIEWLGKRTQGTLPPSDCVRQESD